MANRTAALEWAVPVLDEVETSFFHIVAANRLIGATVSRWRWDLPEVVLSWADRTNGLSRNIRALVGRESTTASITLDVNAWRDLEIPGRPVIRSWRNGSSVITARIPLSAPDNERIDAAVNSAYHTVANWTDTDVSTSAHRMLEP